MSYLEAQKIKSTIENLGGTLIAVSKTFASKRVEEVYTDLDIRDFGENYLNEAVVKIEELSHLDIRWHFIGRLQKGTLNKVLNRFDLIQTIAKLSHLEAINQKTQAKQKVLLQIKHQLDERDYGILEQDLESFLLRAVALGNIEICGLMFLPPSHFEGQELQEAFLWAAQLFATIKEKYGERSSLTSWAVLSMGMSSDFKTALDCGSTHVRLGRAIFGER